MDLTDALKIIKIKCHPNSNPSPVVDEALKVVEEALQRLEQIDNANPSEALKCLKLIEDTIETKIGLGVVNTYLINIIKQELLKTQEQEKILSIIKEKNVDIIYLKDSNNVEEYNSHFGCAICKLTPEEFELLKRYFG